MAVIESCVKGCCCCFDVATTTVKYIVIFIVFILPSIILLALGTTMIVVAAINIDQCQYEPMVPIWMIVGAIVPAPLLFFMILAARDKARSLKSWRKVAAYVALVIFLGWLIAGSVWVLKTWTYATAGCSGSNCCAKIVMNTSVVVLVIHWCFFALSLLILLYVLLKAACCHKDHGAAKPE